MIFWNRFRNSFLELKRINWCKSKAYFRSSFIRENVCVCTLQHTTRLDNQNISVPYMPEAICRRNKYFHSLNVGRISNKRLVIIIIVVIVVIVIVVVVVVRTAKLNGIKFSARYFLTKQAELNIIQVIMVVPWHSWSVMASSAIRSFIVI